MFEPKLGITELEFKELHAFAENYRAEQRTREIKAAKELSEMREKLDRAGDQFNKVWNKMEAEGSQRICESIGSDRFLVISKGFDRLRMAKTDNPDKTLDGYLPKFDDIYDWQEVTFDGHGKDARAATVYHWDGGQLSNYREGREYYWAASTEIPLNKGENFTPDAIVQAFNNLQKIMVVPPTVFESKNK